MPGARYVLRYLGRYRGRYLLGFILLAATNACALAIPWVIKLTIEAVGTRQPLANVAAGALAIAGLAVVGGAVRAGSRFALLGASQRVEADIRQDFLDRLVRLPPAFYRRHRTGDLLSRATSDLGAVAMLLGFGFLSTVNTLLVCAGALTALVRLDPWLTLAALGPGPVLVAVARAFNHRAHGAALAVQEQLARLADRVQEHLTGLAAVRAYGMEAREVEAFRAMNARHLELTLGQARLECAFSPAMGLMVGLGTLVVIGLGGQAVAQGRLTLGALVAFAGYLAALAWPLMALGWVLGLVRRGLVAAGRIAEILETPLPADRALAEPGARSAPAPPPRGLDLEVRDLTFRYRPDRPPALAGLTLRVPAGSFVVVAGPTGAGKSTLAALLTRLEEPPAGSVFLGGRDLRAIPRAELRRLVACVPQEPFLFSRTLAENVCFGAPDVGPDRRDWAAAVAGLADEVAYLAEGWQTLVGERGLTLSGGQRQRATLARALLPGAGLLVLDDPFASVDPAREVAIAEALREAMPGVTVLLITHRLQAAPRADRVLVLDAGRLVEDGTHATLLARNGLYARLWAVSQLRVQTGIAP